MSKDTQVTEEQKIECFGSLEKYESSAIQVAQILNREIQINGLEKHFEDINIMNEFVYPYLQSWIEENKDTITKVLEMKKKVFTQKEIEEYIESNPKENLEFLELKFKELFEEKKLNSQEQERKENLENQQELYTEEEALEKLKNENEKQIQEYRNTYSEESFNLKLKQDIFIYLYSNPKDFEVACNKIVHPKILKGNTEFKIPNNEKGDFDFLVNQVQIVRVDYPCIKFIEAYVPDKKYPEGMTRSSLIQKEKEDECEKELKALYQKFQQQGIDVSAVSKRILSLEKENSNGQIK